MVMGPNNNNKVNDEVQDRRMRTTTTGTIVFPRLLLPPLTPASTINSELVFAAIDMVEAALAIVNDEGYDEGYEEAVQEREEQ